VKTPAAIAVVTLAVAVPAFALTPVLFPPSPHMSPAVTQVPFFVLLGGINAMALGLGVAFLMFGLPAIRRLVPSTSGRAVAVYLAIAWLLMSWYPHGGLHASNGMDAGPLLWIEYGFHLPLIVAPLVLIWALTDARSRPRSTQPSDAAGGTDAEVH